MTASPTVIDANCARDSAQKVSVLAVGPWQEREFSLARGEVADASAWQLIEEFVAACEFLKNCDDPPELLLLAQPLPGEYSQRQIDRLQSVVPLTRIVVVAGSWCEGEMRTGNYLAGTLRLYWYELAPWWQAALGALKGGICPPWSLPLDHPQSGRFVPGSHPKRLQTSSLVAIDAGDYAVFDALSAGLADFGVEAVWQRPRIESGCAGVAAGIWDGGQLSDRELGHLTEFCRRLQPQGGQVVVLLDFPRAEHIGQTRAAGAATVFGKPYVFDEVFAALQL